MNSSFFRQKNTGRTILWSCATIIILLVVSQAKAGGFQVNLQGIKQSGMGHTGAGLAFDASTMQFNPGGLSFAPSSASIGITPIFGSVSYLEPAPGTYSATNEATVSTPFSGYGSGRIHFSNGHKLSIGAGIYTPYGSRVLYADDWKGQFAIREISLATIFVQPTVSYNINDKIGIGGGPIIAFGSLTLRRGVPAQFMDGSYGEALLEGDGNGTGFNVGVFVKPIEALSIGLTHRSQVKFVAEGGQATFTVPSSIDSLFPATTFSGEIVLPSSTTLGFSYKLNEKHLVSLDLQYVGWSVYDSLNFDFVENTSSLEDLKSGRHYKNAMAVRAGWQGELTENFTARGGLVLDFTPVPDGFTTPETPDANKYSLTAGLSYRWKRLSIDASFQYVEGTRRTDINVEQNFGGTYKARAFVPGFGLAYRFEKKAENMSAGPLEAAE